MAKINEKTKIGEIFKIDGAEQILVKHHFPCVHCPMAKMEMDVLEIGQVCQMYRINQEKLLEDLNSFVEQNGKNKSDKPKKSG